MSKPLMADVCRLLKIKQLCTPVYHLQTDGLVERFNQMLRRMLQQVVKEDKDQDMNELLDQFQNVFFTDAVLQDRCQAGSFAKDRTEP